MRFRYSGHVQSQVATDTILEWPLCPNLGGWVGEGGQVGCAGTDINEYLKESLHTISMMTVFFEIN